MATGTPTPQQPATAIRFRRSAERLTPKQLAALRDAFTKAQGISDDRGYNYFAGIHGLPLPIGCGVAHGTEYFLPWHRAYLYFFERALRDLNRDAILPWWDWRTGPTRPSRLPGPYTGATVSGKPNPLASAAIDALARKQARALKDQLGLDPALIRATRTRRAPGTLAPSLPTLDEIKAVLDIRDFVDFSRQLEDLHGQVHVWVGGHMSEIPFAAFDPIFWAHHTMIDRVWRLWQLRHPGALPPARILDEALPPFAMTVRQTLDPTVLGYDYAVSSTSAPRVP